MYHGRRNIARMAAIKMTRSAPIKSLKDIADEEVKDIALDSSWELAKLLTSDLHSLHSFSCSSSLRQNLHTLLKCFLAVVA